MKELMKKIAQIQLEVGKMTKEKEGYNYKYFDINQLLEKLKPLLQEHELVLLQPLVVVHEDTPALRTRIYDYENDVDFEYDVPLPRLSDPQKMGSAITYMRRYALQSLFALEAEDDDGAKAKGVTDKDLDF